MNMNIEGRPIGIARVSKDQHEVRIVFASETGFRSKRKLSYPECLKLIDFIKDKTYINTSFWTRKDFPPEGWEWEGNEEQNPRPYVEDADSQALLALS